MSLERAVRVLCHALLEEVEMDRDSWFRDCLRPSAVEALSELGPGKPERIRDAEVLADLHTLVFTHSEDPLSHPNHPLVRQVRFLLEDAKDRNQGEARP